MPNDDVILRVSSSKDPGYVKRVSGAMAWQLRDNGFCRARAIKVDAVNVAVKAMAILNERVSQAGLVLAMDLRLDQVEASPDSTAVEMLVHDASDCERPARFVEYKVSGRRTGDKTLVPRLAGAVASSARGGTGVSMKCVGAPAVYRAVMASCVAKGHICVNGLDAVVIPRWSSFLSSDGRQMSMVQIDFWGKAQQ